MRIYPEIEQALVNLGFTVEHRQEKDEPAYTYAQRGNLILYITQCIKLKPVSFEEVFERLMKEEKPDAD